jgi:adenosylcobinamide-phosphate synthase
MGLPAISYVVGWLGIELIGTLHAAVGSAMVVILAFTTLAARDLVDHARMVLRALENNSLAVARESVARLVGRDTDRLSESEVIRATVETVAESASDGIIAPLLYLAIGGPALALAYKAINTLDSMVGHHDEKYRYVGWASARLDDAANWMPARITGLLIVLAAGVSTHRMRQSWRTYWRDGRNHPSPNSGWPEAAMAGALGVQLGGTNFYGGQLVNHPRLGDAVVPLGMGHILAALRLMAVASILAVVLAAVGLSL